MRTPKVIAKWLITNALPLLGLIAAGGVIWIGLFTLQKLLHQATGG